MAEYFLRVLNRELGKTIRSVSPEAMALLQNHCWSGNVREFQSAVKFAMVHASGDRILPESLPESCRAPAARRISDLSAPVSAANGSLSQPDTDLMELLNRLMREREPQLYRAINQAVDRVVLGQVLNKTDGNQQRAAEILGISRMTLRSKLRALERIGDGHDSQQGALPADEFIR